MSQKQDLILQTAKQIASCGFKVYIAESKTHGFYTDGKFVVTFQAGYFSLSFSGVYKAFYPTDAHRVGTGWLIEDEVINPSKKFLERCLTTPPPPFIIGSTVVHKLTPELYLAAYGKSSNYTALENIKEA